MGTLHDYRGNFLTFVLLALFSLCVAAAGREGSEEATQSDSIYSGTLELNWKGDYPGCKAMFKVDDTVLQFGPGRSSKEAYYIRLGTPSDSDLVFSARGSSRGEEALGDTERPLVVNKQLSKELNYGLSGNLQQADGTQTVSGNVIAKMLSSGDLARCGVEMEDFSWTPPGAAQTSILFSGWVDDEQATIQGEGMYPMPGRNLNIEYTFTFSGRWNPDSAKLSMKEDEPTWEKASRAVNMVEKATVTAKGSVVTVTPSPTSTLYPTASFMVLSVDYGPPPISTPESDSYSTKSDSEESPSSPLFSRGAVIGITIGAVAGAALLGGLIYFSVRRWHKRRNQVYPEVAWIYAPSSAPSSSSVSDMLYQCAGPGSAGFSSPEPPRIYQEPSHSDRSLKLVEPYEMVMRENRF